MMRVTLVIMLFAIGFIPLAVRAQSGVPHFDVNDISFLWPAARNGADLDELIAIDDIASDQGAILPNDIFQQVLDQALKAQVQSSAGIPIGIAFPDAMTFRNAHNWKVVGIRVDPSAPGTDPRSIASFGEAPQVRLIVQPVVLQNGSVKIHDFAMHLVFEFITDIDASPSQLATPDKGAFGKVLESLKTIKAAALTVVPKTSGDLSVHPALSVRSVDFANVLKTQIKLHLSRARLDAIAFMGIKGAEPWVFIALVKHDNSFVPFPNPNVGRNSAQMLTFSGGSTVMPAPTNSNLGTGVSTAPLFAPGVASKFDSPLFPGTDRPELQSAKVRDVPNIIANPHLSNFPTTDCVSCHTESARRQNLRIDASSSSFAYERPTGISGGAAANLPRHQWNVRNFGWSPFNNPPETVTTRTANEAAASADYINREYFGQPIPVTTSAAPRPKVATNLGAAPATAIIQPKTKMPNTPAPQNPTTDAPVANALTLVMTVKSKEDLAQLKAFLETAQDPAHNKIADAMNRLGIVHFARFVFLSDDKLAVITNYDGDFADYIGAFTEAIGPIFDALLSHMADAPPLPVQQHQDEFLKYVQERDLSQGQPGYSAYPQLKVQDILTLQKNANP